MKPLLGVVSERESACPRRRRWLCKSAAATYSAASSTNTSLPRHDERISAPHERGGIAFRGQGLFYPVTDANFDTGSYLQFAQGYFLRRDAMQWFWDQYAPDESQRDEITASPLRASLDELAGLPPALVINGEADVLRDEGQAYASKLREAGVPVTSVRYQGMIHDFVMLNALRETQAADAAIKQAVSFLSEALGSR